MLRKSIKVSGVSLWIVLLILPAVSFGQGIGFRTSGAVNEGMAGSSTATALDAAGALQWNVASISGLKNSEVSLNLGLALPSIETSSRDPYGNGGGVTEGEPGAVPIPCMAIVHRDSCSRWSWGINLGVIAGSRLSYAGSNHGENYNPILSEQTLNPVTSGLGSLNADIQVFQLAPSLSYALTDKLSVGFGPTLTIGQLSCHPLFLVDRGYDSYPSGTGTRWSWGGGFQVGIFYDTQADWKWGISYKSRQWMEPLRYNTMVSTESGAEARTVSLGLDYPDIISAGVAYTGFHKWLLAVDVRYIFYKSTGRAFNKLGWEDIFSVSIGVQREINDRLTVRGGYCYNDNPVPDIASRENVASPVVIQHALFMGMSYRFLENMTLSAAYGHMFENSVEGPYLGMKAPEAGGYVRNTTSAESFNVGISVFF